MHYIFFIFWGAFWNRARGSQIYGLFHSTAAGRIISMLFLSFAVFIYEAMKNRLASDADTMQLFCLSALMLWCVPAWEKYTSAAMGMPIDMSKSAFAPVDWAMKLWPNPQYGAQSRIWGLIATALRMLLAAPCMLGMAYLSGSNNYVSAFYPAAMAVPYYVLAYIFPKNIKVTMYAELTSGAILGLSILQSIGG